MCRCPPPSRWTWCPRPPPRSTWAMAAAGPCPWPGSPRWPRWPSPGAADSAPDPRRREGLVPSEPTAPSSIRSLPTTTPTDMNTPTHATSPASLSQQLKTQTAAQHERMHQLMERASPFSSRARYVQFVAAQYLFQRDIEHLFDDPRVQAAVPDLAVRGRAQSALDDLADLGVPAPQDELATRQVAMPEALGWLYVSEGSTLGAALLLKEAEGQLGLGAEFGARHLAA